GGQETSRRGLATPYWTPHEGHWQQCQETWHPVVHKGHVMYEAKIDLPVKLSRKEVGPSLPQVIVGMHAPSALLPKAHPFRQVEVNPVHVRQSLLAQRILDVLPVRRTRDHPDFMLPRDLLHPVPSHDRKSVVTGKR